MAAVKSKTVATVDPALISAGVFSPVVEDCEGCERVVDVQGGKYCYAYANPAAKWRLGLCNFATHKKVELAVGQAKVNPLKASKRAMAGRR